MLETDYRRTLSDATDAELDYVSAVRRCAPRKTLTDLAMACRDRWGAVARVCALGEDAARSQIDTPPLRHRHQALHSAWLSRRNWAACGEDAAARCELTGALMHAHLDKSAAPHDGLRLITRN